MARAYTSDVIQLPRLTARSAARLIKQLLNAAGVEKKLPAALVPDRDQLTATRAILVAELSKKIAGDGLGTPRVRAADIVEDNAFGALIDFLAVWERLPADLYPQAVIAKHIHTTLVPGDLKFLTIRPIDEWQEVDLRVGIIKDKGFDTQIEQLGGGVFLQELARAHKIYGEVLGITVVKPTANLPAIAAAFAAATEAIREYTLRVVAHRRKTDPATGELVDRLLAPITNWEDRPARPGDDGEDEDDDLLDDDVVADAAPVTPAPGGPAAPVAPAVEGSEAKPGKVVEK